MNPSHLFLLVTTALSSCGRQNSTSDLSDIYRNDAAMRKPSTKEEIKWTVSLDGCTGSMLSETKLLTANHCAPRAGAEYTSGAALAAGESTDLKAVKVVESSKSLDYSIVEVTWVKPLRKLEQRYTPAIQTTPEQVTVGLDTNPLTSNLITIGFPTDKTGSQTARGFAKKLDVQSLLYNVGTINGNSGGAVWK
ncbi:MAG: trypsin-like peptidase domain-containing protein, partial [Proteobacteria bacterium]|nr:trypsin-like peptidase domain-containing protein [Pseudomonadota bacterium]